MFVMITGHLGFVGSETCRTFDAKGIEYIGYDLMEGNDIRDVCQLDDFVQEYKPDRILHLAAIARFSDADRDPLLCHAINVEGTENVVEIARRYHVPLVYASTGSAIMPLDGYPTPYKEDIPARGNSQYGCSKALGEYLVSQHTPHIVLRYSHIYGKEKRGHGLIGGFIQRIERGLQPILYGGRQTNDFCSVKDIALANYLACIAPWDKWNQIYHIGSGEELSAEAAGEILCRQLGWTGGVKVEVPRTVDPGRFIFDITKARTWLGYEPQFNFEDGLRDMLET